jgi:hypothetical protein
VFAFGEFLGHVLEEVLDFLDLLSDLHHADVFDVLLGHARAPLEVLAQLDDLGVEGECEEHFLLEAGVDLLDDEAVLADLQRELHLLHLVLELVDCQLV